jgi:lysophospholipase L1-like esterase
MNNRRTSRSVLASRQRALHWLVIAGVCGGTPACASSSPSADDGAALSASSTPAETATSSAPQSNSQTPTTSSPSPSSSSPTHTATSNTSTGPVAPTQTTPSGTTLPSSSQPTQVDSSATVTSSAPDSEATSEQTDNPAGGAPALSASASPVDSNLGGAGGTAPATEPDDTSADAGTVPTLGTPPTIYIAGDSTVSNYNDTASTTDQAGWGQMLHLYFDDRVTIDNRALGGRTARRFIDEGHLDEIAEVLSEGDSLLVQFGTNDGNKTAMYELNGQQIPYYLDPSTDFKTYLNQYIDLALDRGATPILVSPPPRNSAYCTGGNGTGGHAAAMRELAEERSVALSDLNRMSVDYLTAICPSPTPEDFFLLRADGTVDGTHFQENGARILAQFVADGIRESEASLAAWLK